MTDFAALVQQLYRHYGTWRKVADACGVGSPALFWKMSRGEILSPASDVKRGIVMASSMLPKTMLPTVTGLQTRRNCGGITINRDLWERIKKWKDKNGFTWDEWMMEAQKIMEKG